MAKQKKKKIIKKKIINISSLTSARARVRGISKVRWLKAVRIKKSKIKNKKIIESLKKKKKYIPKKSFKKKVIKKKVIKEKFIKKKPLKKEVVKRISEARIRKQFNVDLRQTGEYDSEYGYVGIKAITINPDIEIKGLKIAVIEIMRDLFISESDFSVSSYYAPENEKLGRNEELILNDYKVHVLVQLNKKKPIHFIK